MGITHSTDTARGKSLERTPELTVFINRYNKRSLLINSDFKHTIEVLLMQKITYLYYTVRKDNKEGG